MKLRENTSIKVVVSLEVVTAERKSQFVRGKTLPAGRHYTSHRLQTSALIYSTRGLSKNTDTADSIQQHIYAYLSSSLDETTPPNIIISLLLPTILSQAPSSRSALFHPPFLSSFLFLFCPLFSFSFFSFFSFFFLSFLSFLF